METDETTIDCSSGKKKKCIIAAKNIPYIMSLKNTDYRDKIFVYDEHPIAGRDIQYRAPDS